MGQHWFTLIIERFSNVTCLVFSSASIQASNWQKLSELIFCLFLCCTYLQKRGFPQKIVHFVLFCPIKSILFNFLCVFNIFSECWQSTLFQIFFFFFFTCKLLIKSVMGFSPTQGQSHTFPRQPDQQHGLPIARPAFSPPQHAPLCPRGETSPRLCWYAHPSPSHHSAC